MSKKKKKSWLLCIKANRHGRIKESTEHTALLNILELSSLDENNLSESRLGVIGDTDGGNAVLNIDPLVLLGVSLG